MESTGKRDIPRLFKDLRSLQCQESGAAEKTRTSTGVKPTATSTLRVYQFRHGRTLCQRQVGAPVSNMLGLCEAIISR